MWVKDIIDAQISSLCLESPYIVDSARSHTLKTDISGELVTRGFETINDLDLEQRNEGPSVYPQVLAISGGLPPFIPYGNDTDCPPAHPEKIYKELPQFTQLKNDTGPRV